MRHRAMEHKILLFMFLTGLCASTCAINQYLFIHKAKSFDDAQLYCRNTYSDLATINNMEDMKNILATVTDGYSGAAWIGLYQQSTSGWHWSLSIPGFYNKGETEYRNWRTGEPDNAGGIKDCGVIAENGEFLDFPCSYIKRFICYDAASSQKYIIINDYKTWREAQSYCRLYHTDLVSVRNLEENLQVQQVIGPDQAPYIGLFKDNFTWSDSSSSSFRYWASDQPTDGDVSECCVGLDVSRGEWTCVNCTSTIPFFCYTEKKRLILKVEVRSTQNVNDPTVKMAILEKIQQEMKDHGMAEKTKLTWKQQPNGNVFHKKKLSTNAN